MKTETVPPTIPKSKMGAILRLERINSDISSLNVHLNSYTCEPKTPGLFERKQDIKNRIESMRTTNRELINSLREHKKTLDLHLEGISDKFKEFQELERNVLEYIGMAKMHC